MRLLMIEDDKELCDTMVYQLKKQGYEIDICHNGEDAMYYVKQGTHDLIMLDRMLPKMDGLTLLKKIRERKINVPVIMVTAMDGLYDRVDGLDYGADDYLVKPFDIEELLARIRALLRRPRRIETVEEQLSYADLVFDLKESKVECGKERISLSRREAALLEFFILNHDRILIREQILARVWGDHFIEDGNLDNYVYFLRRRLKAIGSKVGIITIYGVGYKMEYNK